MSVTFSLVIPTCNRPEGLALCLDRVSAARARLGHECQVIVSDDSRKESAERAQGTNYPWVEWQQGPHRGPAANRNQGARLARGEWLVFLDDDCLPDEEWLSAYARAVHEHPECAVFEGRVFVDRPRRTLSEVAPANESGGYLWSCNFAIRRSLFEQMGGFDERFPFAAMEDVDLRYRLGRRGLAFRFVYDAAVCHPWRERRGWRELAQHAQSTFIYLSIHPEERKNINASYYLKIAIRDFLKRTLPLAWRLRGRGLCQALMEHIAYFKMAICLAAGRKN